MTVKCGENCFCCDYLMKSESYKFINFNRVFKWKSSFHCESMNSIYVVINSGGFEEYMGETRGQFKGRLCNDRQHIKQSEHW